MHDKDYLLSLLDYNVWANEEYFKQIRDLPVEEVTKQRESLMNSILISVNHLLMIDSVWLCHMKGEKHSFKKLQTVLHENLDDLWAAKKEMDREIRGYVSRLSEDDLEEVIEYELIGGNAGSLPRYWKCGKPAALFDHHPFGDPRGLSPGFHRRHVWPDSGCPRRPGHPGVGAVAKTRVTSLASEPCLRFPLPGRSMSHRNVIRRNIQYPILLASRLRNGLKMCLAPLQLLGHRVQVAEPPLEGTGVEDRGRTRHFVYRVRRFLCLVNGVSRGKPDTHALLNRKLVAGYDFGPYLIQFIQ
jgi:hypothetical protein